MADLALVCTDGSELALAALRSGLRVVDPDAEPVIVMVQDAPDVALLTGSGHAGPAMTPEVFDEARAAAQQHANEVVAATAVELGLPDARTVVLDGDAGHAICAHAEEVDARVIVIGTRGRSGIKRALLGSVSDHVVRNAPCPVVVARPEDD